MALFLPVPVAKKKKRLALVVAGAADALQLAGLPFFFGGGLSIPDLAIDAAVAAILWAVLGFQRRLLVALLIELTPFAVLLPTWTAVVLSLPTLPEDASPPTRP